MNCNKADFYLDSVGLTLLGIKEHLIFGTSYSFSFFGIPSSGKSSVATELGNRLNIPVYNEPEEYQYLKKYLNILMNRENSAIIDSYYDKLAYDALVKDFKEKRHRQFEPNSSVFFKQDLFKEVAKNLACKEEISLMKKIVRSFEKIHKYVTMIEHTSNLGLPASSNIIDSKHPKYQALKQLIKQTISEQSISPGEIFDCRNRPELDYRKIIRRYPTAIPTDYLLFDVRYGDGALANTFEDGIVLAENITNIISRSYPCEYTLTEMKQPNGNDVGNQLEAMEEICLITTIILQDYGKNAFEEQKGLVIDMFSQMMHKLYPDINNSMKIKLSQDKFADGSILQVSSNLLRCHGVSK
ncbi:hypothetical protein TrispH2_006903 [Trichoplax sp. H2]|nr:hypothetical protein TrispH2_006903 [Trichoplax sp. H2]|eukprot:RDD40990.1 hypothetical protein TrispH2_006903 [Trichoplax sp. H2]